MVNSIGSTVTRGRKFDQVLEGARRVFLRDGFAGASVDDIAAEAKVSKATLYSYFPDKELMFSEVFRSELALDFEDSMLGISADQLAAEAIPRIVRAVAARTISARGVRTYRMRVAEAARFPDLAREFLDATHGRIRRTIRDALERWEANGELEIEDIELAAEQLIALSKALIRDQAVFLGSDRISEAQVNRVTQGAAEMFLTCYGADHARGTHCPSGTGLHRTDNGKTAPPIG